MPEPKTKVRTKATTSNGTKETSVTRDYDQAVAEVDGKPFTFRFGGSIFTVDLNIDGGFMLDLLESAHDQTSMIRFFRTIFGEEQWARLKETRQPWAKYEALFTDVMAEMGGPGNVSATSASD